MLLSMSLAGSLDVSSGRRRHEFHCHVLHGRAIAGLDLSHAASAFRFQDLSMGPTEFQPLVVSSLILLVMWLICYWLYRQRIFVRI